ncbi:nucleoside-diphosphate kinase [Candidatus Profftia sp. (ex Adelges kitamiensis)]|uniref:nucleoside-diphosphate kinase n=1 Tax=Candidatus Profftia sp. (ex Adelges kitamiensis) TaxID=2864218 RepID=UPI001CE257D5|nr:nucleoside-diphosphate kinase [Candidatus Profftia sp. (ex Adelges kitamiensis)]
MINECTLSIIKPSAVAKNIIGVIYSRFEAAGLKIIAVKMIHLKCEEAKGFYIEHKDRLFFENLIKSITSGPSIIQILQGKDAIRRNREIMGATNPSDALAGTIRSDYADSLIENVVHGSDSLHSAKREIAYFFTNNKI